MTQRDGNLRAIFAQHLPQFHWQPVETGGTGRGIFDCNYCFKSAEGWVEFKRSEGVNGDIFHLRPEQIAWGERRARAGGRVFIAVRRFQAPKYPGLDELWLFPIEYARVTKIDKTMERHCFGENKPSQWDWVRVLRMLTK